MYTFDNKKIPLFSVIVPAYNSAEFVDKCIESVLNQTSRDFELLLVDDGSVDGTLDVLMGYAERDARVKVIHKENGGHTSARNAGLKASSGRYIIFLDSDDWLSANALSLCGTEIEECSPDIIVFSIVNTLTDSVFGVNIECGRHRVWEDGRIIDNLLMNPEGGSIFPKSLSGKAFKREVILNNQLAVPGEVKVAEDAMAFVGAALDSSLISVIDGAVYYCLVRSDSVSRSSDACAFERLPYLFAFYKKRLDGCCESLKKQFDRYTVAQLYTAALMVMRSGGGRRKLNRGLAAVLSNPEVADSLKNASFSRGGRKLRVKKTILSHRMWWLAKLIDRKK